VFNEAVIHEGIRPSLVGLFADVAATQEDNMVIFVVLLRLLLLSNFRLSSLLHALSVYCLVRYVLLLNE